MKSDDLGSSNHCKSMSNGFFVYLFTSYLFNAKSSSWHGPQAIVFHLKPATSQWALPFWQLWNGLASHYFLRLRHRRKITHELGTSGLCENDVFILRLLLAKIECLLSVSHELGTSGLCENGFFGSAAAAHKNWMSAISVTWIGNIRPMRKWCFRSAAAAHKIDCLLSVSHELGTSGLCENDVFILRLPLTKD